MGGIHRKTGLFWFMPKRPSAAKMGPGVSSRPHADLIGAYGPMGQGALVALKVFAEGHAAADHGEQEGRHGNAEAHQSRNKRARAHGQHNEHIQQCEVDHTGDGVAQRVAGQCGGIVFRVADAEQQHTGDKHAGGHAEGADHLLEPVALQEALAHEQQASHGDDEAQNHHEQNGNDVGGHCLDGQAGHSADHGKFGESTGEAALDFGIDQIVYLKLAHQAPNDEHDDHAVCPNRHALEHGNVGTLGKLYSHVGQPAAKEDDGGVEGKSINAGAHGGFTAGRALLGDILFKAHLHGGGDIGRLAQHSGVLLAGSPVDHNDAQNDAAHQAEGGGGGGYALADRGIVQIHFAEHIAQCAGSAVAAHKADAKLDAELGIHIGVGTLKEHIGEVTGCELQHGNTQANADQGQNILHEFAAAAAVFGLQAQAQGHGRDHGNDQDAGQHIVIAEPVSRNGKDIQNLRAEDQQQKAANHRGRNKCLLQGLAHGAKHHADDQEQAQ